jgi:hypothetical protein
MYENDTHGQSMSAAAGAETVPGSNLPQSMSQKDKQSNG